MTSPIVLFCIALIVVCIDAQSGLQIPNTYVQGQEPAYNIFYNADVYGSGRVDHAQPQPGYAASFVPKPNGSGSLVITSQQSQVPVPTYDAGSHPGYPWSSRPAGPQFNPASEVPLNIHKSVPGYEKEKLPPGYVALVAKIDTPKGYKLVDEQY